MDWQERFWAKVDRRGPVDCWEWQGTKSNGYGSFYVGVKNARVHRISYELLVGPIPDGLQIDHLCRNRACVNPAHLEPVTGRVNVLRGDTVTAANAAKTHCLRGHEFTPQNTKVYGRMRQCLACQRERDRLRKRRLYVPSERPRLRMAVSRYCANGHLRTGASIYVHSRRGRTEYVCRICNREAVARAKDRKTDSEGAP